MKLIPSPTAVSVLKDNIFARLPLLMFIQAERKIQALLNRAHRWVKEAVEDVKEKLPLQMKGIDSDNGSEFKNTKAAAMVQYE